MSLIVSVFIPTGIVLSGDSRTTAYIQQPSATPALTAPVTPATEPEAPAIAVAPVVQIHLPLIISDATYKVFSLFGRYGVSTCGDALVEGMPVAHHIEAFEQGMITPPTTTQQFAAALLAHFRALNPVPNIWFHIAGYDAGEPWIFYVDTSANSTVRANHNSTDVTYGARWNGDFGIANRIATGTVSRVAFDSLNIQDAVDYSRHLIRTTIDQMRFELNFPTVGGPIDTLLITSKQIKFLSRKEIVCA